MTGRRRPTFPRSIGMLTGAVAAGALLMTGCGALPGASGDSREPLTVVTWAPGGDSGPDAANMAGMTAMAQTYARWINGEGGIGGHELRVVTCDEQDTSVGAGNCARRAVKEKAVAVLGSYSRHGRSFMAPLEVAGIPYIGGYGASEEEFRSYMSYPVTGGQSALLAGNAKQLARTCERVSLVRPDTLGGDSQAWLLRTGLTEARRRAPVDVQAAEGTTSYDGAAGRALAGAGTDGGCVTAVLGDRTETFFDSFRRLEPASGSVRISSVLGSIGQPLIDRTGGRESPFEGAYVTGWYPAPGDARWDLMRKVISKHAFGDNRIDPDDTGVQTTWIAYTALKSVIESMNESEITARKVTKALNGGVRVSTGGLTPELRWRYEDMIGSDSYPRIVNSRVTFQVVRDGRLVADKKGFVDVTETLSDASATG
ncbi:MULTISPECIES: ABC transporter substrate-binding protein [unclassified Streptomyces]|uniref:ABC transporter substrate-binding protein n=1 Tax=unclassified Streptomyces TaxID=2593676 RepID=UPI0022526523|nr:MULTISPECIES: ABC transporter substrate-binding protein [unclassified Streptomyces]MCX5142054.1 ABC transporter substrate-binding protein [Streptomyces sp. NBC_00338]WRZ66517.1 ABC transporter substrate-binding protein [Streptomyces sp. NBC_01257]WSU60508.1 ABC transporter substrate-binding protein [Streptomyces sp. NBC_01104]